jgi:hypothetical protein
MNINKLIIIILIFASCESKTEKQNELFKNDSKSVLAEVQNMNDDDQNIRYFMSYGVCDTNEIFKIQNEYMTMGVNIDSLLTNKDSSLLSRAQYDSAEKVMIMLQTKHTNRAIELIEKYGWPDSRRVNNNYFSINPQIIIQHADWSVKDQLLLLLENELKVKRIDTLQFEFMKWNLTGRKGMPNLKGIELIRINKDGTSDTMITK